MTSKLRQELTCWFVFLSMSVYVAGGIFALFVFDSFLNTSLDEEVSGLLSEISPAVALDGGKPTLRQWAARLSDEDVHLRTTIQLYDDHEQLIERYGPAGVKKLGAGVISSGDGRAKFSVLARYKAVVFGGKPIGYLQVQVSTEQRNHALQQIAYTLLVVAPLFAVGLAVTGFLVASKAVRPLEQTLLVLRRFVADAGHELNTPISVIEASVQTLEVSMQEHGMPTDVLEIVSRASQRMKELAANLVTLARLENTAVVSPKVAIEVKDVVVPVVEEFVELAHRGDIEIVCQAVPAITIMGNMDSLRRMLGNLLQNAVRYTEPGGRVTVSVAKQDLHVAIIVEDTGIGIPADQIEHVFDRFFRVDKSRTRAAGGSGLGLSIVKAIVETHKGSILIDSVVGKGSRFTVLLPMRT